jgi:aspartate/methionine/tyrosine aminotransferase
MEMPELKDVIGLSLRDAERELETAPGPDRILDATYADTHRFPPPEWVIPTFVESAGGGGMTYTPYRGDRGVRETVSANIRDVLGVPTGDGIEPILTPGTQGALFIALAAILEPGDVVLLPDPDYLSTERMLRYFGAEVVRIPVIFPEHGRPVLDEDALEAAAARHPKLMVFSHPNNPTGLLYEDSTLRAIARFAEQEDFYVLADQLYCRLVYDGNEFTNFAALDGMKERTVTLLGPSKTESLSGYRLGVGVAPEALLKRMEDVQSCTALRAPAYAQHILARWLIDDQEFLTTRVKEYQALRDMTVDALNASDVMRVRPAFGSAYVFPQVLVDATDREISLALKRDAGIVVNPGYQFGIDGIGHMRLCFAQEETAWESALERILDVVGRFPKK